MTLVAAVMVGALIGACDERDAEKTITSFTEKSASMETGYASRSSPKTGQGSRRAGSKLLLAIGSIGRLGWRCEANREFVSLSADPRTATNEVTIFQGLSKVGSRYLHPGQQMTVPLRPDRVLRWTIRQQTEPRTLTARVTIESSLRKGCVAYLPPAVELGFDSDSHDVSVMPRENDSRG